MMRATSRIAVLMLPALIACSHSARLPAPSETSQAPETRPVAPQPAARAADRFLILAPPRADPRAADAPADTLTIVVTDPLDSAAIARPRNPDDDRPPLIVRRETPRAARDALDAGVTGVITADAATIAYATTRADLVVVPLPWDRVYVLATPLDSTAAPGDAEGSWAVGDRSALASDAVRVDARAAGDHYWWTDSSSCTASDTAGPSTPVLTAAPTVVPPPRRSSLAGQHRLAYPRDDEVARALAGRLVALRARRDPSAQAIGLAAADLPVALADGRVGAAIVAIPRRVSSPCKASARWRAGWPASWPATSSTGAATPRWLPLIETRPHAVVRRDRVGLSLDADDALHVLPPNTPAAPPGAAP
jgi:hypothetical protein